MLDLFLNITDLLTKANPSQIYSIIFTTLIANGLFNIPSSQIIYLTLGYLININDFNFYWAVFLGTLGNTIGNLILYKIIYKNSNFLNNKVLLFLGVKSETLFKYNDTFKNKWWGWLILGKLTPSVKVFVPIICGLSKIDLKKSIIIFFTGSLLWAIIVTYLGFYFGKQSSLINFYLAVTLIYILIGTYGYLKMKNKKINQN